MELLTSDQRALSAIAAPADLLWSGRPGQGIRFRMPDIFRSLGGVVILIFGFVIVSQMRASSTGSSFSAFLALWSIGWFGTGVWLVCGRVIWDAFLRSRTVYGLTKDGNALIVRQGFGNSVKTIYLPALSTIGYDAAGDDVATISFGEPTPPPWWNSRRGPIPPPAFEYISGASKVFDLIGDLQQGRRTA